MFKLPIVNVDLEKLVQLNSKTSARKGGAKGPYELKDFRPVEIDEVDIERRLSHKIFTMLKHHKKDGKRVNGSDKGFAVCLAMRRAGFSRDQILTVLTDRERFKLARIGWDRRPESRGTAAAWVDQYCYQPAIYKVDPTNVSRDEFGDANPAERKLQLTFENFDDLTLDPNTSALIEDYIDHGSAIVIFGEANSGKTFFALDLALHIAIGKNWRGKKVGGGPVLYVAAEGGRRIRERIIAFRKEHGLE